MLVCHQYLVCKKYVGSVYVGGYGWWSERKRTSSMMCPVDFLVVGVVVGVVVVVVDLPLSVEGSNIRLHVY